MKTFLREPLLHFLLLGVGLFFLYGYLQRGALDDDPQTIVVDRGKLLAYLQYRSRAFDAAHFNELLNTLPQEELQRIVRGYLREEALYREAKALQLDKNDYVSRRRLIQQLEYITRGFADAKVELTEEQIRRHYEENKSDYEVKPKATFTHVFFSIEQHGAENAQELARAELRKLNGSRVRFDQAPAHGERFLYHINYVQREPEEVASHFGEQMQRQLFSLQPNKWIWRGPFRSPYGFHLVLLTSQEEGFLPPLTAVRARVEYEARQALLDARFEQSIESIVKAYKVKFELIQTREPAAIKASS